MTLPERLYACPAAFDSSPLRATARYTGVRFNFDGAPSLLHAFDGVGPAQIYLRRAEVDAPEHHRFRAPAEPPRLSCPHCNSHSLITASVAPATYSKRPYRNRPGR